MPFRSPPPPAAVPSTDTVAHRHAASPNAVLRPGRDDAVPGDSAQRIGAATGYAPADSRTARRRPAPTTTEPRTAPSFDRRTALRVAGAGTLGAFALGATAACAEEPIHDPDPLATHELQARADAAAARAAIAIAPHLQATLTTIATQRTEHAETLSAEIARIIGVYGDGTTPVHKTREPSAAPAPVTAPSIDQLRDQLNRSRRATAELAVTLSGYRAGLLASISAACAVHAEGLIA